MEKTIVFAEECQMNPIFAGKKRRMRGRFCMVFWLLAAVPFLFAVDYYREGEELFRRNAPAEAIPLLYQASLQPGTDPRVFVYLGLCYQQEGKYSDAVSTFIKGTSAPGADKKVLFFNAGNVYFTQQLFPQAEEMFSQLVKQMAEHEGVTEKLKADNQMEWVARMNNIRQRATEVVNSEMIYK